MKSQSPSQSRSDLFTRMLLPFCPPNVQDLEEEQLRKRLLEHVRYPMRIDMGSIRKEQAAAARSKALTKYKVKRADLERWLKQ